MPSINTAKWKRLAKRLGFVALGGALTGLVAFLTSHPIGDPTLFAMVILGLREADTWAVREAEAK